MLYEKSSAFSRPYMEEEPGPPCSQRTTGADTFPVSAGKNQKKRLAFVVLLTVMKPEWEVRGRGRLGRFTRERFLQWGQ